MGIKGLLAIVLVLTLALVGLVGCTSEDTSGIELPSGRRINVGNQQDGIWANGYGEATVIPDIVSLQLGIEAQKASVAEAQTEAVTAMDRVMTALRTVEVAGQS